MTSADRLVGLQEEAAACRDPGKSEADANAGESRLFALIREEILTRRRRRGGKKGIREAFWQGKIRWDGKSLEPLPSTWVCLAPGF